MRINIDDGGTAATWLQVDTAGRQTTMEMPLNLEPRSPQTPDPYWIPSTTSEENREILRAVLPALTLGEDEILGIMASEGNLQIQPSTGKHFVHIDFDKNLIRDYIQLPDATNPNQSEFSFESTYANGTTKINSIDITQYEIGEATDHVHLSIDSHGILNGTSNGKKIDMRTHFYASDPLEQGEKKMHFAIGELGNQHDLAISGSFDKKGNFHIANSAGPLYSID